MNDEKPMEVRAAVAPTALSERIRSLDVLRGIAVTLTGSGTGTSSSSTV